MSIPVLLRAALLATLGMAAWSTHAASPLERSVKDQTLGVTLERSPATGFARSVRADRLQALPTGTLSTRAEERARSFLGINRDAFIDAASPLELATVRVNELDDTGMSHVRLQQTLHGLRIRGAEVFVHMNPTGVVAATSKLLPQLAGLATTPIISSDAAVELARAVIGKKYPARSGTYSVPELEIFDAGLLNDTPNHPRLTWFIKVNDWRLNEYIWIDARNGDLLGSINQVTGALNRQIFDGRNSTTATPVLTRAEGGAASTVAEVNALYDFAGAFHSYFFTSFNRDSFNNLGARITGIARACDPAEPCPMVNAFWDGTTANFGAGFTAEDVVAHELSHAVVQYTADLIYQNESGAMNESYADIFGETIQLTDLKHTTLPADRWKMGEDLNIANVVARGVGLRNMMNPTVFGDPASTKDSRYVCTTADNGGVHSNSGIGNKAYALMSDGGTLNGYTVRGIGLAKSAAVQYRALSAYLGNASTYLDNYNALVSACSDLAGGTLGISVDDCAQVKTATLAVHMTTKPCTAAVAPAPPPSAPAPTPAGGGMCPAGLNPLFAFSDNFENTATGNWVNTIATGRSAWMSATTPASLYVSGHAQAGTYSLHGGGSAAASDSAVELKNNVTIPNGAMLRFDSDYNFETGFDAGVIEYSTDAGSTWRDAGEMISAGRNYDGGVGPSLNNSLAGRRAFTGTTGGYRTTQLDLSPLAGNNARFRFRMATDNGVASMGWWIDNLSLFSCIEAKSLVITPAGGSVVTAAGKSTTLTVALPSAPAQNVVIPVSVSAAEVAAVSPASLTFTPVNWNTRQTITVTGKSASAATYSINFGAIQSSDASYQAAPVVTIDASNLATTNASSGASAGATKQSVATAALELLSLMGLIGLRVLRRRLSVLINSA